MIGRLGAYGGKSTADQLADAKRDFQRELSKSNPDATRLAVLRAKIVDLGGKVGDEDTAAIRQYAERTGLAQALQVYGPQDPVVTSTTVQVDAPRWPLVVGGLALVAAVVLS